MKKYNITLILLYLFIYSCSDVVSLKEKPLGLYTAENSFTKPSDFKAANTRIYAIIRDKIYQSNQHFTAMFNTGTDIGLRNGDAAADRQFNDYANNLNSHMGEVENLWDICYEIISDANVVIGRIDDEDIEFSSEVKRDRLKAEAMFFRAFGYRFLVDIYGGVPLVLKEVQGSKRNFTRASKEEVVKQIISDLKYATENLPEVTEREADGRLCRAAAYHLLAEMYITSGDPEKAIDAATWVIDNPNFALMTERFGSAKDAPGDVYWDLFRFGNQNRQGGLNTEAIWVCQFEPDIAGGGNSARNERFIGPQYYIIQDSDGTPLFIGPTIQHGGRGISWTGITQYADSLIWERSGWNDMRTSQYNILRDFNADNPNSPYYGQNVIENGLIQQKYFDLETWNPTFVKNVPIHDYPERYILDEETGLLSGSAGRINPDNYIMRLAGTYLLRAEAYLDNNDPINAAADINVVRARANATPIGPGDVNIDYILDERARELMWEVPRRLTLQRINELVDRVNEYNRYASGTIKDYHHIWPIPYSEIENNPNGNIEQNPGYAN